VASKPKATPRASGEQASLELERPLGAGLSPPPSRPGSTGLRGWFLLQEPSDVAGFLSGSLGTLSVEEVFTHVLSGIRSGLLAVQHGTVRRTVSFRDGQVVFATSTERWERLGAVLLRLGLLTQAQLTQALSRVTPSRRIRQVLTSEGLVSEADPYSAMTYVVREVVLSWSPARKGRCPARSASSCAWARAPRWESCAPPTRVGTAPSTRGWKRPCAVAISRWGPASRLRPQGPRGEDLAWAQLSAEERYNQLLSLIHQALRDAGQDEELLRGFLDAPSPGLEGAFAAVAPGPDGRVDVARLSANLASGGEAEGRALTLEALDAIVSYALFSARNVLPPEVAEWLSNTYRKLQGGLA